VGDAVIRITSIRNRSKGFTLVEILVAIMIGMFGILIMMQMLANSESQKRTTTSGNDALNEGALALYTLQSDLQTAGTGITDPALLGCTVTLRTVPSALTIPFMPVIVNSPNVATFPMPAPDANTDTLFVFSSTSTGSPQGDRVTGAGNQVQNPPGYAVNDYVIWVPMTYSGSTPSRPSPCNLTLARVATVNLAARTITLDSGAVMNQGDYIFNFGPSYRAVGYAIRSGNLTSCDYSVNTGTGCGDTSNWVAINNNIVSMRVQYGRDTTSTSWTDPNTGKTYLMDGTVDLFDVPNPAVAKTYCEVARISAVRLALLSRSAFMTDATVRADGTTTPPVTTVMPTWDGSTAGTPSGSTAAPFVSPAGTDWQYYRYRVFQSIFPIRNVVWVGRAETC
jgi:type IV pilus assembly protein PilW